MLLQSPAHTTTNTAQQHRHPDTTTQPATRGKRKAESQDNERLHKRLSLLNLEQNGQKLYVPVETPTPSTTLAARPSPPGASNGTQSQPLDDMQVDDTKHKVYIYSLDDELSSSDSEPDDGRLVFLPDIERHLRRHRMHLPPATPPIPRPVPVSPEGELAGMQVVLYREPASISVPAEQDSVRKAIIETRARTRERQRRERAGGEAVEMPPRVDPSIIAAASRTAPFQAGATSFAQPLQPQDDAMDLD